MSDRQRFQQTFSISMASAALLRTRSKDTGDKMSRIVEQGIYLVCQQPVPEDAEEDDRGLGPTRSERVMLEVITEAGMGWHEDLALANEAGLSLALARKALKALQREGKAFEWGPSRRRVIRPTRCAGEIEINYDEAYYPVDTGNVAWGTQPPMVALEKVLDVFRRKGEPVRGHVTRVVFRLALAVRDIVPFRRAVAAVLWPKFDPDSIGVKNAAEYEADIAADDRAKREAWEDQQRQEGIARVAAQKAHDAEQKRLDAEFRAQMASGEA